MQYQSGSTYTPERWLIIITDSNEGSGNSSKIITGLRTVCFFFILACMTAWLHRDKWPGLGKGRALTGRPLLLGPVAIIHRRSSADWAECWTGKDVYEASNCSLWPCLSPSVFHSHSPTHQLMIGPVRYLRPSESHNLSNIDEATSAEAEGKRKQEYYLS